MAFQCREEYSSPLFLHRHRTSNEKAATAQETAVSRGTGKVTSLLHVHFTNILLLLPVYFDFTKKLIYEYRLYIN
jgi:hypothetical protein